MRRAWAVVLWIVGCGSPPSSTVELTSLSTPPSSPPSTPRGDASPRRPADPQPPPPEPWMLDAARLRAPLNPRLGDACDASSTSRPPLGNPAMVPCGSDGRVAIEEQWSAIPQSPPCSPRRIEVVEPPGLHYVYGLCVTGTRLYMDVPCLSCFSNGNAVRLYDLATMTPEEHRALRAELHLPDDGPASAAAWAAYAAAKPSDSNP